MDRFDRPCKRARGGCGDFAVDGAFSAHMRGPLTGAAAGWKLGAVP
jgi:hypothetical protein